MDAEKVRTFIQLAGQEVAQSLQTGSPEQRALGAQLLLSEVLEYIVHGLGVTPRVDGVALDKPDSLSYTAEREPDPLEMIDGLADVAYTMFWNSEVFGVPLEDAYSLVCDNNLEKFVRLEQPTLPGALSAEAWHCGQGVSWPAEVVRVEVLRLGGHCYAVGKDVRGKVRKPGHYKAVDLRGLLPSHPAAAEPAAEACVSAG